MATIYVTHHEYPDNPQSFVIDVTQIVKMTGESNNSIYYEGQGEEYWDVVIYTSGLDSNGDNIGPFWITDVGSSTELNDLIRSKIGDICQQIDWTKTSLSSETFDAGSDRNSPYITWTYPTDGQTDVPIDSRISVRIKDNLPSNGIDISTLTFKVNGMAVTPEVEGHKYDYTVSYRPIVSK